MVHRVKRAFRRAYDTGARLYLSPVLRREQERPAVRGVGEYLFQFEFALRQVAKHAPTELLDVGSGLSAWPKLVAETGVRVTATDEMQSYWGGMFNRHYNVVPDDITKTRLDRQFDMVTCLGVLTTIADDRPAVGNLFSLVKPGGHLVLTFAYKEDRAVPNAYALPGATYGHNARYICRMFSRAELEGWLEEFGGELEEQELFQVFTGELWTFGERLHPPVRVAPGDLHHYTAVSIRKR
jgi:2-polyprenyl-3-methyl-5-hydroxy-6-metoxy-1,4-benzoquinol methylase